MPKKVRVKTIVNPARKHGFVVLNIFKKKSSSAAASTHQSAPSVPPAGAEHLFDLEPIYLGQHCSISLPGKELFAQFPSKVRLQPGIRL